MPLDAIRALVAHLDRMLACIAGVNKTSLSAPLRLCSTAGCGDLDTRSQTVMTRVRRAISLRIPNAYLELYHRIDSMDTYLEHSSDRKIRALANRALCASRTPSRVRKRWQAQRPGCFIVPHLRPTSRCSSSMVIDPAAPSCCTIQSSSSHCTSTEVRTTRGDPKVREHQIAAELGA
jgi:hypothetical protein